MNSAELVNLIIQKLRRVELLVIQNRPSVAVRFVWGGNEYTAVVNFDNYIAVYKWIKPSACIVDIYQQHVEGRLNGKVRNDAGEMVQP